MVSNNEAIENFLNGKRNLAAFQFSQLIQETTSGDQDKSEAPSTSSSTNDKVNDLETTLSNLSLGTSVTTENDRPSTSVENNSKTAKQTQNSDEIAFNYAMVNLFTGCPQRASMIFSDLVKRYPRNPRLWLRLAESMLAAERSKMSEFEHIQQLAYPHSRDHLIKTKNNPILIKINPNYCKQQLQQRFQTQRGTPPSFLKTIKEILQKSLDLINEYNDISLTDDSSNRSTNAQHNVGHSLIRSISSMTIEGASNTSLPPNQSSQSLFDTQTPSSSTPSVAKSKLSPHLSYEDPYRSIKRSALYHLKNKVQLNLAYVCLCMGEPAKALNFTTQCLKSSPQGYEKLLSSLYHAEACILANRVDEAIQFLNLEILNMAKSLSPEHLMNVGDDSQRVVFGDDMQNQFDSGSLATVVTYNLSVAYAAKGEFNNAHKILTRCIHPTKPCPMQVIICLLYIQLQQGQLESAKKTILSNLPQFR